MVSELPVPGLYNHKVQSLAAAAEEQPSRLAARWLLLWHLCSLDAPTIAVAWSLLLLRLVEARPQASQMLVLFLGTWVVYVLDRILDCQTSDCRLPDCQIPESLGRLPSSAPLPSPWSAPDRSLASGCDAFTGDGARQPLANVRRLAERHYFHHRHRRLLLTLSGLAAILVALLCRVLSPRLVLIYLLLGGPVLAYAYWVHGRSRSAALPATPSNSGDRPELVKQRAEEQARQQAKEQAKEPVVAILFTAAVAAPASVSSPRGSHLALLCACVLLGLLCWLNCAVISFAEAPTIAARERAKLGVLAAALAAIAAAGCGRASASTAGYLWHLFPAAAAVIVSSLLLLALLFGAGDGGQLSRSRMRVLADAALLTPWLFLLPRI